MWRSVASNFLTIAILLLAAVAGVIAWGKNQYAGPGPLADAICLKVPAGSTFRDVAGDLAERGAVASAYIFKVGAEYEDKADKLKAGSFLVPPHAPMAAIVDVITRGGQSTCGTEVNYQIGVNAANLVLRELDPATSAYVEVVKFDPAAEAAPTAYTNAAAEADVRLRITLAEGVTSWQVVDALKRADFLSGEAGDVPPEGMLSPDSYEVTRGEARGDLLAEMQARQAATLAELWPARAKGLPYATPEEALTMASIVEKETGIPEERPLVASVFLNRLAQGMKLQTDPTVIYGITKGQGVLGRGLRQSELRGRTPYNTYVIEGLPPTPIANPGRDSIAAALNPATSDYLFFVAKTLTPSDGHVFAATLAEHNDNVAKLRELEAQQKAGSGN
jgi:UPF0755 protein